MGENIEKALFLDRDNTIIIDSGYMHRPEQIQFFDDTFEALRLAQSKGYSLFMVTNQSGVGRGLFPIEDVFTMFEAINQKLVEQDIKPFIDIALCPHHPDDGCECRKPSPKMINDLVEKYKLNKENCVMIGDRDSDYECGVNANIKSITILLKNQNSNLIDHISALG